MIGNRVIQGSLVEKEATGTISKAKIIIIKKEVSDAGIEPRDLMLVGLFKLSGEERWHYLQSLEPKSSALPLGQPPY